MYVGGMSTRDVEALWAETYGQSVLSRRGVSALSEQLSSDCDRWRSRDLSALTVVSLCLDALYLPVRQGTDEKAGVLAAYGIVEDGRTVRLHVALGSRESYEAWLSVLHDMTARGLKEPVLVISDGRPGLRKAVREGFPCARKQRCPVHKMRNILTKLPRSVQAEMKRLIEQVFGAASSQQGLKRGRALIARCQSRFPAAMECLEKDLEEGLTYLKLPKEPHVRIRTTNLLERPFGEGRRRTTVIPPFPPGRAGLKLVYATLLTASKTWRGVRMTSQILREIDRVRAELGARENRHGALAA
jgi:transposase-like protein